MNTSTDEARRVAAARLAAAREDYTTKVRAWIASRGDAEPAAHEALKVARVELRAARRAAFEQGVGW